MTRLRLRSQAGEYTHYKWLALFWIALAELCALSLWFSASAVLPQLQQEWGMNAVMGSWMTAVVQIGFIVGALAITLLGTADRFDPRIIFAAAAAFGAAMNLCFSLSTNVVTGLTFRFLTGIAMAGIYPIAVKLLSTWFPDRKELGIGILIAALTLGSSSPHLLLLLTPDVHWKVLMLMSSLLALLSAGIMIRVFPHTNQSTKSAGVSSSALKQIVSNRPIMLANYGYFGHMWELYAMWTWLPYFLSASFHTFLRGSELQMWSTWYAFLTIGISGAIGSVMGGWLSEKIGKARLSLFAMVISSLSALAIGFTFEGAIWITVSVAIIWGMSVIADSAQFSAVVAVFSKPEHVGTGLTFQMAIGFMFTIFSIYLIPVLEAWMGWQWVFSILAIGPILGVLAMIPLIRYENQRRMDNKTN